MESIQNTTQVSTIETISPPVVSPVDLSPNAPVATDESAGQCSWVYKRACGILPKGYRCKNSRLEGKVFCHMHHKAARDKNFQAICGVNYQRSFIYEAKGLYESVKSPMLENGGYTALFQGEKNE